jgi:hypothetical protein
MPKAAAISATTMMSVGIRRLPRFSAREHDVGGANESFDPNQMGVLKGVTSAAPARSPNSIVCGQRRKHSASSFDMAHSLKVAARERPIPQDRGEIKGLADG